MARVLLLNASYEPLAVITLKRAASLLLKERAEAAGEDALEVRTVSQTLQIPTVLRLRYYVNAPRRGARWSRRAVLRRDGYTCIYCGITLGGKQRGKIMAKDSFTVDHILPISRGGQNTWGNTACACPVCNQRKGNRTPHEANLKLRWEPKTPRVQYIVAAGEIPSAWKMYLDLNVWR